MTYTIKQLSRLAGVSVRTLHYYDEIGLLKPQFVSLNGYRHYGEEELIRLQSILFFRELDFPLEKIKSIIAMPGFNAIEALRDQRKLITAKKNRLERLIYTIDQTIMKLEGEQMMTDEELYEGFNKETAEHYQQEAQERWGNTDAYKQSMERVKRLSKDEWNKVKQEGSDITVAIAEQMKAGKPASDPATQELIKRHHAHIGFFYDCTLEIYRGLGEMYVTDPRFTAFYENVAPGLADYMQKAMSYYCDQNEKQQEIIS